MVLFAANEEVAGAAMALGEAEASTLLLARAAENEGVIISVSTLFKDVGEAAEGEGLSEDGELRVADDTTCLSGVEPALPLPRNLSRNCIRRKETASEKKAHEKRSNADNGTTIVTGRVQKVAVYTDLIFIKGATHKDELCEERKKKTDKTGKKTDAVANSNG